MRSTAQSKVTISILTYNRCTLIRQLLASLSALEYLNPEVIVIDNSSEDATEHIVTNLFPSTKYTKTEMNRGPVARNLGMRQASNEIIITLDDDIFGITGKHIAIIIKYFNNNPQLAAVNFKVLDYKTHLICNWVHHYPAENYAQKEFVTHEITEGAVAFRKTVLSQVGYYPEHFFMSHEGPDLALRILNAGYQIIYSPKVAVFHSHAESGRRTWFNYYYDTRNQFWLAARNLPTSYALKYLSRGLLSMLIYSLRDGFFRYWLKGVIDGIQGLPTALNQRSAINEDVMKIIKKAEKNRPNIFHYIRKRLFRKKVRL